MAFISGLPDAGSDIVHNIQLQYFGHVQTMTLYDRPGNDFLSNKGDLWDFSLRLSGYITLSAIQRVSIVAGGSDGWNIESIITLVRDSEGRIQVLTRDFDVDRWIDDDNSRNQRFDLTFSLSDVGSGMSSMIDYSSSANIFIWI